MFSGLNSLLRKVLPKRLFYRALLIVAVPVIVLQLIITIVFFDSLWIKTNKGMTRTLVNEISAFIEAYESEKNDKQEINNLFSLFLDLNIELKPNKNYEELNVKNILKEINTILYDKIYFSSFDLSSCIILKETAPYLKCGFLNDDFTKFNIDETIDICKKYNFFSCGINLNLFSNSVVNQFVENEIEVTVYADNNISKVEAHNLWNNSVTSIFIDDPTEYI